MVIISVSQAEDLGSIPGYRMLIPELAVLAQLGDTLIVKVILAQLEKHLFCTLMVRVQVPFGPSDKKFTKNTKISYFSENQLPLKT